MDEHIRKYALGTILNEIGNFDMRGFTGRLVLQKTVYLLKSFGIDLGYVYHWYLHGVYNPTLTRTGFELHDNDALKALPDEMVFADDYTQKKYDLFLKFIHNKKHDPDKLEIASSICYLYDAKFSKEDIIHHVEKKKERFTENQCLDMWNELEKYGVFRNER